MDRLCGWKKNQKLLFIWELLTKTYERPTTQFKRATYLVIYLFNRMTARRNNANEGGKGARAVFSGPNTAKVCKLTNRPRKTSHCFPFSGKTQSRMGCGAIQNKVSTSFERY